jgi:hypothetical protein
MTLLTFLWASIRFFAQETLLYNALSPLFPFAFSNASGKCTWIERAQRPIGGVFLAHTWRQGLIVLVGLITAMKSLRLGRDGAQNTRGSFSILSFLIPKILNNSITERANINSMKIRTLCCFEPRMGVLIITTVSFVYLVVFGLASSTENSPFGIVWSRF